MEEKIPSRQINRLAAIQFIILPVITLMSYIRLLASPDTIPLNFSFYLLFLRSAAYILIAVALFRAKKDKLFLVAFTLPVVISLISLILHYGKVNSLLDLLTYGSLYFVVLGANGYIPKCKKATQYLCLLPGIIGAIRQISSFTYALTGILYSVCYVFALLVTGVWALAQTREETLQPPVPVAKLPGIGLITFGTLFLISRAVDIVLHYGWMRQLIEATGVEMPHTMETYLGASPIELLLCVIVSICAIYGGILLCHQKAPEIE